MILFLVLVLVPTLTRAQTSEGTASPIEQDERVVQYNLAGPRLGATFAPDGTAGSQFGWHFEHQVASGPRGPWFIVERVFLVGGMENNQFVPNGTMIFGMRLPGSLEFGVGPSVTIGGYRGVNTGIVVAAGQSFRVGGIRIPMNVAIAGERNGEYRVTLLTGWAIRQPMAH